jgi:signal transduction histidine kinase
LIGLFLAFLQTPFGRRQYRVFGMILLMLPTVCISLMIYRVGDPASPYYAGLNLVLLMLGFVLHWTFRESVLAVALVLATYLAACLFHLGPASSYMSGHFFNNLYFLVLTGVTVATGSYFLNVLRFREFAGRYELDRNKRELEESNRKLLELDQAKSRFFANISHELRTPLTLMLAPLEDLQARGGQALDEEMRQTLATMHTNGMRLLKLINDLLELVRLDAGIMQLHREPVEVGGFVSGLASAARQLAQGRRLGLETKIEPGVGWVMLDRDKLEKIILNLQFNALKFTPPGGRVEIGVCRQGEELVIQVQDTGMGIAEKNLPSVFSRFWQADSSSRRRHPGAGIGLALVKELTELQGGAVSVQSREGKGTTFTVRLPYLPAQPGEAAAPTGPGRLAADRAGSEFDTTASEEWLASLYRRAELLPATAPARRTARQRKADRAEVRARVLIADDEPDMLHFLAQQMQIDYEVVEAVDGQEAINAAMQSLPDLVLLDMMMPGKDGLQVCRELRQRPATHNVPILLLTARADEETKLAALSAGANDFLPKPFSTTELHVRVRNLVASFQFQRRLARQNQLLETTIVELKETETQLVQTEKLASLGRMSAGIIHEINNPLNYAKTGLYTLRRRSQGLPEPQRAGFEDLLNEIEDGLNRVKNIVLELGPFARQAPDAYDLHKVVDLVNAALRFLSHEWKDKVSVELEIPVGLSAWANQAHVIQVLVNILQNSLDAVAQKRYEEGQPTIWITGREADGRCYLAVRDNGPGIAPEIMPKIFEPFFTTKDVGDGMGLGLNICYRIMQAHQGRIEVKSEPGRFCEFTLEFAGREPQPQSLELTAGAGL